MPATNTKRQQANAAPQQELQLPELPECPLPRIRGLVTQTNVRESVAYITLRYKDISSRGGASTLKLRCWDPAMFDIIANLKEHQDVEVAFAPRLSQNSKTGAWEEWHYLATLWY